MAAATSIRQPFSWSTMKLFLVALTLVCAALAAPNYEPIGLYYHENYGIARAAEIKASEEASDFDGSRIVGGSHATLGQYPHLGGLIITLASGATSVCGSTLVSNTRLVTAAHCWTDGRQNARSLIVVLGSLRLFSGGQRINSSTVQLHANYNHNNLHNDIAMINIARVNYTPQINRIAIATGSNQFAGQSSRAAGFGKTGDNINISNNQALSHVTMPVITNAVCQRTYGAATIIASTLCTDTSGGRGTCQGDSGGSLQVGNTFMGVTSFVAQAGCQRGHPAGFARVSSFASWIQARM